MEEDSFHFKKEVLEKPLLQKGSIVHLKEEFSKSPSSEIEMPPTSAMLVCAVIPANEFSPERYLACDVALAYKHPELQELLKDPFATAESIEHFVTRTLGKRVLNVCQEDIQKILPNKFLSEE